MSGCPSCSTYRAVVEKAAAFRRKHKADDDPEGALHEFNEFCDAVDAYLAQPAKEPEPVLETPTQKAEKAYQRMQRTQELNRKICEIGACIHKECQEKADAAKGKT